MPQKLIGTPFAAPGALSSTIIRDQTLRERQAVFRVQRRMERHEKLEQGAIECLLICLVQNNKKNMRLTDTCNLSQRKFPGIV